MGVKYMPLDLVQSNMSEQQPNGDYETIEIEGVDGDTVANRDPETAITSHPLVELLTPRGKVRIIVALLRVRGEKLPASDICTKAFIGRNTWYEHHEELLNYGVIEEAGTAGNSTLYRANMDSPIVQLLDEITGHGATIKHEQIEQQREHVE
jgi:hypothetical protein